MENKKIYYFVAVLERHEVVEYARLPDDVPDELRQQILQLLKQCLAEEIYIYLGIYMGTYWGALFEDRKLSEEEMIVKFTNLTKGGSSFNQVIYVPIDISEDTENCSVCDKLSCPKNPARLN